MTALFKTGSDSRYNFLVVLLCVYYILYQVNEYFGLLPVTIISKYLFIYLTAGVLTFCIGWFLLRSTQRSSLYTTFGFSIFFFFGAYHDTVKSVTYLAPASSYKFNLTAIAIVLVAALILIKKTGINKIVKINRFCFTVLAILVFWELSILLYNTFSGRQLQNDLGDVHKTLSKNYLSCDTCRKPDIYFIVFDGFASLQSLRDEFDFDNRQLDSFLIDKGFYIVDSSSSNYPITTLSMASVLNLNYLDSSRFQKTLDIPLLMRGCETMYQNELTRILQKENYKINNYGVFDLKGYELNRTYFEDVEEAMIHQQTLIGRIERDILWNFRVKNIFTGKKRVSDHSIRERDSHIHDFITKNIRSVYQVASRKSDKPMFTYCHVMMPHEPFVFNKDGSLNQDVDTLPTSPAQRMKLLYLNQVIYASQVIQQMTDSILKATNGNSIIILQGDHGYRGYENVADKNKIFQNLNCFYFPDKDYRTLYKSVSTVNTFRIVANKYFGKTYPLLKDTSIYIAYKGFFFERTD